jgi:SAM-dependent methyltransferase
MDDAMLLSRTCPACRTGGAQLRRNRYSQGDWVLKECLTCGFVFLENPPDYATLQGQFSWENTSGLQNEARRKSYSRGENVVRSAIRGVRNLTNTVIRRDKHVSLGYRYFRQGWIVDLGCGLGNFSPLPPSCKLLGIEISTRIVADARPIFESRGGRIIHADVLSGLQSLEAASCDGALVESYLEHEVQPAEVLRELSRVLRSGSAIILKLPNYACWNRRMRGEKWCGFRLPDHVNYFTPDTLRTMLGQQGFEIARFTFLDRLWTNDNMWCVARKKEH